MSDRYPGCDVLAKRHTASWNEKTRRVIDERVAMPRGPRFFTLEQYQTLEAVCGRIMPQPKERPPVPIASMVDAKLFKKSGDGYRDSRLPPIDEAWRRGLEALDAEARRRHRAGFATLTGEEQDALLAAAQAGELTGDAWGAMACALFFAKRLLHDIVSSHYAHATAWNEIGFGGPASPRGYVRMDFDRRDPWEVAEAAPGRRMRARHQ
jgi:hypothetical protein